MDKKINVLIAHEISLIRTGLREILKEDECIEIVGIARNGKDLLALADKYLPDIIITDIIFSGSEDMQLIKILSAHHPQAKIIALPRNRDDINIDEIMRSARGLLSQYSSQNEISQCIQKVHNGSTYYRYRTLDSLRIKSKTTPFIAAKALVSVLLNTN